jgi:Protein of unknown function (DUF3168)
MSTAARRGLYGKLAGDTTLTNLLASAPTGYTKAIYHAQAPETANFPMVVFSKNSGIPTEAFGDPTALQTDVWLVKAVDRSSTADTAEAIAARVSVLLDDAALSLAGGERVLYLRRQSDVDYAELVSGVTYHHVGGLYRLVTEP